MRVGGAPSVISRPCMSRVVNATAGGAGVTAADASVASRTSAAMRIARTASAPRAHAGGLERGHLGPHERGRPREVDEQRGARSLAEAEREIQVRLDVQVIQDDRVAKLRPAIRGE